MTSECNTDFRAISNVLPVSCEATVQVSSHYYTPTEKNKIKSGRGSLIFLHNLLLIKIFRNVLRKNI